MTETSPAPSGLSQCDRCHRIWPSAPSDTIHKCQCTGGMCKPMTQIEVDAARWRYMSQPGFFRTGPYTTQMDWSGYSVGVRPTNQCNLNDHVAGRADTFAAAIDKALVGDKRPMPKREHYHTELIKRTIIQAITRNSQGLGLAQASRLAADEIITLFDPMHKKMEPFCNCPTGIHDDAYDPGGPLSGMPRPLCLLHNPNPRSR